MIVKDEAHVIERCLRSVLPFIDTWLIVDTGSTDGTPEVIRSFMAQAGIPGEVVSRPWRDFGTNRSEALDLARTRADYTLIIDADEVFEVGAAFALPALEADAYQILHVHRQSHTTFWLTQLVRNSLPFHYVGVLHEVIVCDQPATSAKLEGVVTRGHFDSARNKVSQEEKYSRDARVLEDALQREPENARYVFYLAQSYRDAGALEKAIEAYDRRSKMGGFEEEAWYADLQVARLLDKTGRRDEAILRWLRAFERRSTRAETLCDLARLHREMKHYRLAYLFAGRAMEIARPHDDLLFLEDWAYRFSARDERAVAAYWCGEYAECQALCLALLDLPELSGAERERVERNLSFARARLGK